MAHRVFADRFGRSWEVWEVCPGTVERRSRVARPPQEAERRKRDEPRLVVAEPLSHGWLAFQTKHEKRRLAPIPDGWTALTDGELAELLGRATLMGKPRRLLD